MFAGAEPVDEGYFCDNVLASYVHLHFGSNPAFAYSLVAQCRTVNVTKACDAAHEAVLFPPRHTRSGSNSNSGRNTAGMQGNSCRTSLSLVRSVPNLARLPHEVTVRRGYAAAPKAVLTESILNKLPWSASYRLSRYCAVSALLRTSVSVVFLSTVGVVTSMPWGNETDLQSKHTF